MCFYVYVCALLKIHYRKRKGTHRVYAVLYEHTMNLSWKATEVTTETKPTKNWTIDVNSHIYTGGIIIAFRCTCVNLHTGMDSAIVMTHYLVAYRVHLSWYGW